jgi:hypothetical protein
LFDLPKQPVASRIRLWRSADMPTPVILGTFRYSVHRTEPAFEEAVVRREWEPEELVAAWTLVEQDERELVAYKRGATRLGFALILKFFEIEARFPRHASEFPPAAVAYVARQVGVDPTELAGYEWVGSTAEYHRSQIRRALGFRRFSEDDEAKLAGWLADEVAPLELSDERLREALLTRCRTERIESPARVDRILGTARTAVSDQFTTSAVSRLSPATVAGLEALAGIGSNGQDPAAGAWLAELKADPGRVSRDTLRSELTKLTRVRALGLPHQLFDGWSDKLVAAWRARAAAEYPSDLRSHHQEVRLTLLATLAWTRQGEIVDGLVDLLIALVHKIDARAEQGAQAELVADLHRVRGKENLLFRLAEVALEHPDDTVRNALYPVIGPNTLAELVREGRASESALRARTRVRLRASYSSYYRRVIPELLEALEFRSSNTRHAPVIDALALMGRYARRPKVRYYSAEETVPLDGVVPADWRAAVVEDRGDGTTHVERIRTSYAAWPRCARRSVAAKCGSSARSAGATLTSTCPPTSRPTAPGTTSGSANRWTRASSSPTCGANCLQRCLTSMQPSPRTTPAASASVPGLGDHGSPCRSWPNNPNRRTWNGSRSRCRPAGARWTCWTSSPKPTTTSG